MGQDLFWMSLLLIKAALDRMYSKKKVLYEHKSKMLTFKKKKTVFNFFQDFVDKYS